jgi:hypothetical protein
LGQSAHVHGKIAWPGPHRCARDDADDAAAAQRSAVLAAAVAGRSILACRPGGLRVTMPRQSGRGDAYQPGGLSRRRDRLQAAWVSCAMP